MKLIFAGIAFCLAFTNQAGRVSTGRCALKNCKLTSPLATEGPGFPDGVRFFQLDQDGTDHRAVCPFGPDNPEEKDFTRKEHVDYLKDMNKVADMSREERIAYAKAANAQMEKEALEAKPSKEPKVDLATPGVHALNYTTFTEVRNKNEFDLLVVFYAPWCPHCKAFVLEGSNPPINALSADLEQANGPKVVTFDVIKEDPPHTIDAVPTVYLYTRDGRALIYQQDIHNSEALRAFAMQQQEGNKLLLAQKEVSHKVQDTVSPWLCPLENCVLKSPLAMAGPGFQDGVNFFTAGNSRACPFAQSDSNWVSTYKREGNSYHFEKEPLRHALPTVAKTSVDVTKPGVESVDENTWEELHSADEYDFLVAYYAPWCGHCKAMVLADNAPLKQLSTKLEKLNGPKVVSFDIEASNPPLAIDAIPDVYLYPKGGHPMRYKGDPANVAAVLAWTLDNASPTEQKLVQVKQHLRKAQ